MKNNNTTIDYRMTSGHLLGSAVAAFGMKNFVCVKLPVS